MPYLLIEDGFADNTKITGLSDKAFRLHLSALVYCARNLTDGDLSEIAVRSAGLNAGLKRPLSVVKELEAAGLWIKLRAPKTVLAPPKRDPKTVLASTNEPLNGELTTENGASNSALWKIHDYLKHNPTRAEIEGKRHLARERKRRQRGHSHTGQSRGTSRVRHATQDPPQEPLRGSLVTSSPPGSSQRHQAITAATNLAKTWTTPDSDAFATRLDELQLEHGITLGALERETLWDTAHAASANGHTTPAPTLKAPDFLPSGDPA